MIPWIWHCKESSKFEKKNIALSKRYLRPLSELTATYEQKIDERLSATLQKAARDKVIAEEALKEARLMLAEKEMMIE